MENETVTECEGELSDTQRQAIDALSWWLDVVAYLVMGLIGMMLNMIAMKILLSPIMWNNFFNRLLMFLSAFDSVFILCGLVELFRRWQHSSFQQYLFTNIVYPVRSMAMCSSIYTTMVLTLERYQAITSPIKYRNRGVSLSLGKRLFVYVVPVMLFSFVYYFPKFFDLYVEEELVCSQNDSKTLRNDLEKDEDADNCQTKHKIRPTSLRTNRQYIFWYLNVSNLIVTCIIPIGLLVFLNCRIASCLNKYRQRRPNKAACMKTSDATSLNASTGSRQRINIDVKQTFMLFSIVILFVLCHALRIIMNTTEFLSLERLDIERKKGCDGLTFWQHISMPLSEFLLLFNSSAHFFVYMVFDKTFQELLRDRFLLIKQIFRCSKPSQLNTNAPNEEKILVPKVTPEATSKVAKDNDVELMQMNGGNAETTQKSAKCAQI